MSNVHEAFKTWYKSKYYKYDLYPKYHQFRVEVEDAYIQGYKAALAEIDKCEPVAEVRLSITGRKELFLPSFNAIFATFGTGVGQGFEVGTKLFTSPQPREWVGLSDDQVDEILESTSAFDSYGIVRRVVQTLKQLNTSMEC